MKLSTLSQPSDAILKKAIWIYFILWIFEGALRKWILPSLATPLLVVRDPIAIYIIFRAFNLKLNFTKNYVVYGWLTTLFSLLITILFGHGNLFVGLYGARIMILHFPLIFIIGEVFAKEDILKMGRVLLAVNIIMSIIVFLQFSSPQTALINIGVGGEGSAGFAGSMGYSRPPGTFSFISGLTVFYTFVSVFVFYFWLSKESCSKILLYCSTVALVIGLPLTISRGAVGGVALVGLFAVIAAGTSGKTLLKLLIFSMMFYILILILQSTTAIFNLGIEVFSSRVENANGDGGLKESVFLRAINSFTEPLVSILDQPIIAGNLGMGTNAGSQLLNGKVTYLVSEGEIGRLSGEGGVIIGGILIGLRSILALSFVIKSWSLPQTERLLPFIMCGIASMLMIQGQWAQPSILGGSIISAGLLLACINLNRELK